VLTMLLPRVVRATAAETLQSPNVTRGVGRARRLGQAAFEEVACQGLNDRVSIPSGRFKTVFRATCAHSGSEVAGPDCAVTF
jgi:hypothetical protein